MSRLHSLVVVVALAGSALLAASCRPEVPENDSCEGDWFTQFLIAGEPDTSADLSCVGDTLVNDNPFDASCQTTATLDARTVDHQSKDPVGGMTVSFFANDNLDSDASWTETSDGDGLFTQQVPLCTPIAYVNDRNDNDSRITVGQHVVLEPGENGDAPTFDFRNVANGTVSLIATILSVNQKDENGFMFGKVAGCDGDAAVDHVQVLVHDETCSVPKDYLAGYTDNEFPSAFLLSTTTDGFFFGNNIPPGDWVVEGYVNDGDSFKLIASTSISVKAKQVTLADLQIGRSDGVRLHESCTSACN
jgi:hypothetical protein